MFWSLIRDGPRSTLNPTITATAIAPGAGARASRLRPSGLAVACAACWKSGRYLPYPSAASRSTGTKRSAAEFMQ